MGWVVSEALSVAVSANARYAPRAVQTFVVQASGSRTTSASLASRFAYGREATDLRIGAESVGGAGEGADSGNELSVGWRRQFGLQDVEQRTPLSLAR